MGRKPKRCPFCKREVEVHWARDDSIGCGYKRWICADCAEEEAKAYASEHQPEYNRHGRVSGERSKR